ncbi:hypothetical protein EMIHUDRAFT_99528 [Emiliania huxleyi CCMP1516]|uniref:ShKT domain-containing protein n=2 Tax=Emiliania huxleyi TaxID=2903 RepID=A0A0D3K2S8_EMIH1|nr:hypothetical protein EMIHUDRAFT_99528 [Emiliania huxleyi CCMP1516]EOD30063.1 hypothetical protein EMIHUDRAFT_99528 [Emiliania huxleyi CCMP1516]|eukprot:XP_005782492.1 hypothetical protein EMIHUDRAFT_99528 [Emiliania huxleyi CCMP1516]
MILILLGALLEVGLAAQTCTECTDEPNTYMVTNGLVCDEYPSAYTKFCKQNANWAKQKFCQRSCFENGAGYDGDVCCAVAPPAPTTATCTECTDEPNTYMVTNGLVCDEYPSAYTKFCKQNANWAKQKFCQRSCFENGAGYDGDVCCAAAPTAPTTATCTECTDEPNTYMVTNGLVCDEYPSAYTKFCKQNANWAKQKFCQRSCFENGAGYDGDVCCAAAPTAPTTATCTECTDEPNTYMVTNGLVCEEYPSAYTKFCKQNANWAKQKFCQRSCFENGAGYDGDVCCAAAPTAPTTATCTECTDEPNTYMVTNGLVCDEYPSAYTKFCKQNANWAKQKFCQRSCFENGAGYDGDVCCAAAPTAPTTATCTECTDEPNTYMVTNGLVCDEYPSAYTKFCKQNANWAKQKFCQRSCFENGAGYDGDVCCAPTTAECTECTDEPNTYMVTNGLVCDEYPSAYTKFCKQNANWAKQKFCQRSCFENGAGYDGDAHTPSPRAKTRPAAAARRRGSQSTPRPARSSSCARSTVLPFKYVRSEEDVLRISAGGTNAFAALVGPVLRNA